MILPSKRSKCVRILSYRACFKYPDILSPGMSLLAPFPPSLFLQPVPVAAAVDEGGLGGGDVTLA